MIGLGSNRLTVCRRGGMSVTQAGKGGMEWLAGGRVPSWASPYSAQATAALKAQFPTQWPTIRDYGFAHPEIVPYVNANPLCAAIWCCYVQDGLVFQMDCNYECTAAKWKDVRSAIEFAGNGSVAIQDGVPYFNGSAWYNNANNLPYAYNTCTIEVVFTREKTGRANLLDNNLNGTIGFLFYSYYQGIGSNGAFSTRFVARDTLGEFTRVGIAGSLGIQDGVAMTTQGTDYWTASSSGTTIGGGREKWQGKIYAIRIYNRLLTEREILANQAIDLQRWQAS